MNYSPAFQQNIFHSYCCRQEELNPRICNARKHFLEDGMIHFYIPEIISGIIYMERITKKRQISV
jgi:hypothetical protein